MNGPPLATTMTPGPADGPIPTPEWVPDWVPQWIPEAVATIAVVVLAWGTARLLVRLLNRRIARRFGRPSLTRTALRGIRAGVYVLGFLVILWINGLDLGNIALSVTVFSAVIGVVLAPIIGSYISGMFLLADQPYEIGDMVELPDVAQRGFVEDITLRYTKIFTLDNTFVVIPNGTIRERDVVNYSAEDPRTRRSIDVLITYESDRKLAQEVIENAARKVDRVIEGGPRIRVGASRYPAGPDCLVRSFADNGVLLRLRLWLTEPYHVESDLSRVREAIDDALAETDVEYAYPHSHLFFDETSGALEVSDRLDGDVPGSPGDGTDSLDGGTGDSLDGGTDDSLDGGTNDSPDGGTAGSLHGDAADSSGGGSEGGPDG